jgi:crotonobetainyl-CoA:carnitine CoA-transferase CaiB-like acyl-CoA transferase
MFDVAETVRFSAYRPRASWPTPPKGRDTRAILKEIGRSDEEIAAMLAEGSVVAFEGVDAPKA